MTSLRPVPKSEHELQEFFCKAFFHTSALYGVAVGVHVGLFDVMTLFDKPATSQEIAHKGDYKERYVREWLGCMVMAGLVSVDDTSCLYLLPHSHRKLLEKNNLCSITAAILTITGHSFQQVCECFQKNGPPGIDYNLPHIKMFEDYLEKESRETYTWDEMKSNVIDKVPDLSQELESGIKVLKIGCNRSMTLIMLAEKYPKSKFVGIDVSSTALDISKKEIEIRGLKNIQVLYGDIYKMEEEWNCTFDWVFCADVIHDLPYVIPALQAMKQVAKPEAYKSIIDVQSHSKLIDNLDSPGHGITLTFSLFYCLPLSLNSEGSDGMGTAWGVEQARQKIKESGLELIGDNLAFGHLRHFVCK